MKSNLKINKQEPLVIEFEKRTLYISDNHTVVLCTGVGRDSNYFEGVCIYHEYAGMAGDYSECWLRRDFVIFHGDVILSN